MFEQTTTQLIEVQKPEQNHTPNSYKIENDIFGVETGRIISKEVVEHQLVTLLSERVKLPLSKPYWIENKNGTLYSKDFPNTTLLDLYDTPTNDPVYEFRRPADVEAIRRLQEKSNTSDQFTWVLISPTTGAMSRETFVELGVKIDSQNIHAFRLCIPFREGQTTEEVFEEAKSLASVFKPELAFAKDERDLLASPIFIEDEAERNELLLESLIHGGKTRDRLIQLIDDHMYRISGQPYYMGRLQGEFSVEEHTRFNEAIERMNKDGIFRRYTQRLFDLKSNDRPSIQELTALFNSIVNNFDLLWEEDQSEDTYTRPLEFIPEPPKRVAGGCGGVGEDRNELGSTTGIYRNDIIGAGINLPEDEDKYGSREFECPFCRRLNYRRYNMLEPHCQSCGMEQPQCGTTSAVEILSDLSRKFSDN